MKVLKGPVSEESSTVQIFEEGCILNLKYSWRANMKRDFYLDVYTILNRI